ILRKLIGLRRNREVSRRVEHDVPFRNIEKCSLHTTGPDVPPPGVTPLCVCGKNGLLSILVPPPLMSFDGESIVIALSAVSEIVSAFTVKLPSAVSAISPAST